jgi:hypothetical protein
VCRSSPERPKTRFRGRGEVGSAARVRHCVGLVGMVFALARLGCALLTVVFAFFAARNVVQRVGDCVMELCYVHVETRLAVMCVQRKG